MKLTSKEILQQPLLPGQTGIWYLGQEGILFKSGGKHLVVDPYLSDYVDRNCSATVSWKRLYPPPMSPEDLAFVDYVLCTHLHFDHADPETLSRMARANPSIRFVVPAPGVETVAGYGIDPANIIPALADTPILLERFTLIPIPAAHEQLHQDAQGRYLELGYGIETNGQSYFHAGDMCLYDGLVDRLRAMELHMAFLPINGRDYFRNRDDIIGNLSCREAVLLAKEVGAEVLVPLHHDLYAVNRVSLCEFVGEMEQFDPRRRFHVFSPGELYLDETREATE